MRPDRMSNKEFTALCESIWGTFWRRRASKSLGRDPKMMARYSTGDSIVPPEVSERLTQMANIGPAGEIIKTAAIARLSSKDSFGTERVSVTERAHFIAADAIEELRKRGIVE